MLNSCLSFSKPAIPSCLCLAYLHLGAFFLNMLYVIEHLKYLEHLYVLEVSTVILNGSHSIENLSNVNFNCFTNCSDSHRSALEGKNISLGKNMFSPYNISDGEYNLSLL